MRVWVRGYGLQAGIGKNALGGQSIPINCNTIGPVINWSGIKPFTNTNLFAILIGPTDMY
jgi:hypothetical protein